MRLEETWPLALPYAMGLLKMYANFIHLCYPLFVLLIGELRNADSQGVNSFFFFLVFVSIVFIHFLNQCYTCLWSVLGFVILFKPLGMLRLIESSWPIEGLLLEVCIFLVGWPLTLI